MAGRIIPIFIVLMLTANTALAAEACDSHVIPATQPAVSDLQTEVAQLHKEIAKLTAMLQASEEANHREIAKLRAEVQLQTKLIQSGTDATNQAHQKLQTSLNGIQNDMTNFRNYVRNLKRLLMALFNDRQGMVGGGLWNYD